MTRFTFERTIGLGFFLVAAIVIFCLQGCATFGGGSMTLDQKAALIRATTTSATTIGLAQIEDLDERSETAATVVMIADKIVQVLDNNGPTLNGQQVIDLVSNLIPPDDFAHVSPEVRAALVSIVDILLTQVEIPDVGSVIPADALVLIRAGLEGVSYGAQLHVTKPVTLFIVETGDLLTIYPVGVQYDNLGNYNVPDDA